MRYAILGHLTKDVTPDGFRWGGGVTYSGWTVAKQGVEVQVITSAEPNPAFYDLDPHVQWFIDPHPQTTTFDNRYDALGNRQQWVRARAGNIPLSRLSELPAIPDIVHLSPVANEVDTSVLPELPPETWLVATPQGWMRHITAEGHVETQAWQQAAQLLPRLYALVISEEDVAGDFDLVRSYAAVGPLVAYTRGYNGVILLSKGEEHHVPAIPAQVVDLTGAGDVFAAAFFVRLRETNDAIAAAIYGTAAATIAIEHFGTDGLPSREKIMARLSATL